MATTPHNCYEVIFSKKRVNMDTFRSNYDQVLKNVNIFISFTETNTTE